MHRAQPHSDVDFRQHALRRLRRVQVRVSGQGVHVQRRTRTPARKRQLDVVVHPGPHVAIGVDTPDHWRLGALVGHARAGGGRHRRRAAAIGFEPDISRSLARRKADCGVIACVSDPRRNWRRAALGAIEESPRHRRECAQLAATVARQRVAHHPAEAVSGTEDARLVDAVILGYRLQEHGQKTSCRHRWQTDPSRHSSHSG